MAIPEKTLIDLAWPELVEHLAATCRTGRGTRVARELDFPESLEDAVTRIGRISEARLLYALEAPPPFGGIHDVDRAIERAEKGGVLDAAELIAIAETVAGCARLGRHVKARQAEAPRLAEIAALIAELGHVSGPVRDAFDDTGRLADHASPSLGPLRRKLAQLHDDLARRARSLLEDAAIAPFLQDRFYTQREERYVVPIRAEARSRVRGIVHGTSQSGQTVFVEPDEVVDLNNRLKIVESEVVEEERRILTELTAIIQDEAPAIRRGIEATTLLDVLDAAARMADKLEASAPEVGPGGSLMLLRARHPLMVLGGRECVPNDLDLAAGTILVVSGPNAGGKTVALKTLGMCAMMARAGLHVPADAGSRVPWYRSIRTDIGDEQSLERNLSTFSAHLIRLREFLEDAAGDALLLLDELAVGTDPDQGAALAQAVLEELAARGAQAVVTTHYERLKALAPLDPRFVNASFGFDLERMTPTFKIHVGMPGASGAVVLARRLGLPDAITARAEVLLGDRRTGIDELLQSVADERRRLDEERDAATRARREAEAERAEAAAARKSADQRLREIRKGAYDDATAALRRTRDEIDRLRAALKKPEADPAAARATLGALANDLAPHAPLAPAPPGHPASDEDLVPGAPVWVASLGARGQIVSRQDGRVVVQVGPLKSTVNVGDVRVEDARPKKRPASAPAPATRRPSRPPVAREQTAEEDDLTPTRTVDTTLDVRGARVDEALAEVDRFVDDALVAERDVLFIVHGHGTGALKSAIRDHLKLHAAISRFRPGTPREGGDGVTVLWLG
jgi:DNA mismatch repair protein MutS2